MGKDGNHLIGATTARPPGRRVYSEAEYDVMAHCMTTPVLNTSTPALAGLTGERLAPLKNSVSDGSTLSEMIYKIRLPTLFGLAMAWQRTLAVNNLRKVISLWWRV